MDVRHDDAVLHDGAGVDRAACGDDGVRDGAINFAALGDEAVLILRLAGDDARRHGVVPGIDAVALLTVEIEGGVLAQQVHVGLPQGADRADVLPVALEFIGEQAVALVQNGGDDVLAEVVLGTRVLLVLDEELFQHAPLEDVDAHGCVRALRMLRLLLEFVDGAVLPGVHDAEAAGLGQRDRAHGDGAVGLHLLVVAQHGGIVHLIDVVAGEDDDIVRIIALDEGDVLIDVPFGILALGIGRQDLHAAVAAVQTPRLAVADVLIELERLILRQHADGVNAGVHAVGERKIDDAILTAERDRRLCRVLRQHHQAAPLPARQQHRDAVLFLEVHGHFSFSSFRILPFSCAGLSFCGRRPRRAARA